MKAKHKSLKNLIDRHGWDLVGTNEYDDIKKNHLLDMRNTNRPLVVYTAPNKNWNDSVLYFKKFRKGDKPVGTEWNNNFYGITAYGLILIREIAPEIKTDYMLTELFDWLFNGDDEFEVRTPHLFK